MGEKRNQLTQILNSSQIGACCVLNPYKSVGKSPKPKHPKLAAWADSGSPKNLSLAVGKADLNSTQAYLAKGVALVKALPWAGNCQTFACASASLIVSSKQFSGSIELFSFGDKHTGHVFLVLNRAPTASEDDPATWGRALIVDVWYAIQDQTPAAPVYKGGTYMTWLSGMTRIQRVLQIQ